MTHRYIIPSTVLFSLALLLVHSHALAAREYRFDINKIGVGNKNVLRSKVMGQSRNIRFGASAIASADIGTSRLAQQVHKLMPNQNDYERVLITPDHVALQRKDGIHEVIRRHDAMRHILQHKQLTPEKVEVGIGWRGSSIWAEQGPNNTIFLYRQLPRRADGQISSSHGNTSFALDKGDALNPFGNPGPTVRIAMPSTIFQKAVDGKEGAVGWNNFGDGYSTGLEVLTEVQLSSSRVGKLFN